MPKQTVTYSRLLELARNIIAEVSKHTPEPGSIPNRELTDTIASMMAGTLGSRGFHIIGGGRPPTKATGLFPPESLYARAYNHLPDRKRVGT